MNLIRRKKQQQNRYFFQRKAGWKKIHVITDSYSDGFDGREGFDQKKRYYSFLTNFRLDELPAYTEAIRTYQGSAEFGICDIAWGGGNEEGYGEYKIGSDHRALYYRLNDDFCLTAFWRHFDQMVRN